MELMMILETLSVQRKFKININNKSIKVFWDDVESSDEVGFEQL
jgi:hypothetical protein